MSDFWRAVIFGVSLTGSAFVIAGICYIVDYVVSASRSADDAHERISRLRDDLFELQEKLKRGDK